MSISLGTGIALPASSRSGNRKEPTFRILGILRGWVRADGTGVVLQAREEDKQRIVPSPFEVIAECAHLLQLALRKRESNGCRV